MGISEVIRVSVPGVAPVHGMNWWWGWSLILAAFVTGAAVGMFFDREDFWGGYGSFRRRLVRLGHVALAALGMINVLYALSPWPVSGTLASRVAAAGFAAGGTLMPAVCFLAAWRVGFRRWFFVPVGSLVAAVIAVLLGGC